MRLRIVGVVVLSLWGAAARSDQLVRQAPLVAAAHLAAPAASEPPDPSSGLVYTCPMDPDIRSHAAGTCRRCGMTLVAGVPEPVEFHVDAATFPPAPVPGRLAVLEFRVHDPWKHRPVRDFNVVHERLLHSFVVSEDLEFFDHGHPSLVADGVFQYPLTFPSPGLYRVLADFYPSGSTPQLAAQTVVVPGDPPAAVNLLRDYSTKTTANLRISLATVPDRPIATERTQLRLVVEGEKGLEPYLGAWGHMLIASGDLIDLMHEHPFLADGGPRIEFEVVFPRPGTHRVWVQFQSDGVVNTARFDIPVDTPALASF